MITGASRGIGLSTTKKCLEYGFRVIANYRSYNDELELLKADYGNDRIIICQTDVADPIGVKRMFEQSKTQFGELDGIVCNAGIIKRTSDWREISAYDWFDTINVNLIGTWNIIRYGVDFLHNNSSIVTVSSIYGLHPETSVLPYSVSKAAVIAMTQALAKELSPIRVNSVAPGNTLTSMIPEEQKLKAIEEKTQLKRSARPDEIADSIIYLLSDESSYLTGCVIPIDGGYHLI